MPTLDKYVNKACDPQEEFSAVEAKLTEANTFDKEPTDQTTERSQVQAPVTNNSEGKYSTL